MAKTILPLLPCILLLAASVHAGPPAPLRLSLPEISPWSLFAGPCLLGGWMFIRRRRRKI